MVDNSITFKPTLTSNDFVLKSNVKNEVHTLPVSLAPNAIVLEIKNNQCVFTFLYSSAEPEKESNLDSEKIRIWVGKYSLKITKILLTCLNTELPALYKNLKNIINELSKDLESSSAKRNYRIVLNFFDQHQGEILRIVSGN